MPPNSSESTQTAGEPRTSLVRHLESDLPQTHQTQPSHPLRDLVSRKSPALMAGQSSSYPSTRLQRNKSGHKTNLPDPRGSIASGPALAADPLGTDDLAPFFSKPCFLQAERANSAARRRMEQIRRTASAEGMLHSGNTIVAVSKTVHENFRTTLGWLCRFAFEATPEAEPEKVDLLDNVASALAREHLTILERLPVRLGSG